MKYQQLAISRGWWEFRDMVIFCALIGIGRSRHDNVARQDKMTNKG